MTAANHKLPTPPGTHLFQQGTATTLRTWPKSRNGESLGMASQMRNAKETPRHSKKKKKKIIRRQKYSSINLYAHLASQGKRFSRAPELSACLTGTATPNAPKTPLGTGRNATGFTLCAAA